MRCQNLVWIFEPGRTLVVDDPHDMTMFAPIPLVGYTLLGLSATLQGCSDLDLGVSEIFDLFVAPEPIEGPNELLGKQTNNGTYIF